MSDETRATTAAEPPTLASSTVSSSSDSCPALACRSCGTALCEVFLDLGATPLANSFREPSALLCGESFYPLTVYVCGHCLLVQVPQVVPPGEIFSDYAYFSSISSSWLEHSRRYAAMAITRFGLDSASLVVEVASNDGYLLRWFAEAGVPVLGIEPASNVAAVAEEAGVPTLARFFGESLARELVAAGKKADLLVGNNVLAHVPDLNDFVAGLALLLAPQGVLTLEFPHLLRLIEGGQFDTVYHEHFSYFTLLALGAVFERHGLEIFEVEELPTHGGSLRVFVRHQGSAHPLSTSVAEVIRQEEAAGLGELAGYRAFAPTVARVKRDLLRFLLAAAERGETVAGYGAPAKGNTLLNYCGVGPDLLPFTVDRSPHKQGLYLPGTRIPILHPDALYEARPDYVLILPWNLRREISEQLSDLGSAGTRFVVAVPELSVWP